MSNAEATCAAIWKVEVAWTAFSERSASHGRFDGALLVKSALMLVDELAGDDAEHFFYALAVFCADLVAAVPDVLLTPEATAAVAVW